jgi:hypothetical protein
MTTGPASTPWPSRTAKGAASELVACAYLMRQGWHVYRCESPTAPFDLAAYRDGRLLRVEVKSIYWPGADDFGVGPSTAWPTNDEWDLLVVADPNNGSCIEIVTHDAHEGRNQIRAIHGFPPVGRRLNRAELVDVASQGGSAPVTMVLPPVPSSITRFERSVLDLLRRDLSATWTRSAAHQVLVEEGWTGGKSPGGELKTVKGAFRMLLDYGLITSESPRKERYRAAVVPTTQEGQP